MPEDAKRPKYPVRTAPGTSEAFDAVGASTLQRTGGIAHETGELHRLLVESVEDYAIFALDVEGYILSWNPGAERFKGYTADEAIGKHFSTFYPPERIAEGFPEYELREAARLGRFEDEGWRIRKDGSRFWASVVLTALHNSAGQLIGYAKVTRDLSARREAEEALRESEERFRLLVSGVKDYAILMLNPSGFITTWNEGAERIKGYSASEIIGRHFSTFYTDEDIADDKPTRELEIATRTGQYEEEGTRVRKDGSHFWASVLITAIRTADGRLVGFAKVTRDLTERRAAAEQALDDARRVAAEEAARRAAEVARARAERLQRLTGALSAAYTIPDVVRLVFTDGFRAVGVDAGALALADESRTRVRVTNNEGYDKLPEWVLNVGTDEELPVSVVIRTGSAVICRSRDERDARFPRLAEVLAPFAATVVLPLAARGQTVGALAMHFRQSLASNDESVEFMEALAQQVAQAIERAALYEAEQQARTHADEANRAKSEFLAAMSHELRTPLNAIGGYTELIEMELHGPITPEQRADIQRIKRSQQHLLGIINDILNFARIEAGQTSYDFEPVKLCEVLDAVGQMIQPQATGKGLVFSVGECPVEVVAWADKARVEQILLNLLSNAVKFTEHGSVTLSCDWENAQQVELTVRDTGLGIPTDQLDRIFEPFIQVGRSLTSSREGTGLGLAISRDLARAMGGDITVTSEVGAGSALTLVLPKSERRS